MHFNFDFSTGQILWTLTFAALLVLLVVLLGRDRVRRFPWFTTLMVLMALDRLAGRLLSHRIAPVVSDWIFLTLADLSAIIALLVVVEIARRAFAGADRKMWTVGTLALLAVGGVVLALWGRWPPFNAIVAASKLSALPLMNLFRQKANLLADVLIVQLGLLVVLFGRYFKAGWHSHTLQLAIGLAMASLSRLAIYGALQSPAMQTFHSQDEYKRAVDLMHSLDNANSIIFIVVLVWWIICLWIDEPGAESRDQGTGIREQETGASS
ncbi:MAG TPA: hypothetical protein VJX73_06680 [Terracidiphilus sp.]|nr:hypothetical protein [Terracidiphilus sp.]